MLNDLLNLAKLESGKAALPQQRTAPRELVESAVQHLQSFVEARGSRLATEIEPGLPSVLVDAQQISHVLSNFVSNAAKHNKAGEEIRLTAKEHHGYIRFSVIDRGSGIAPQYQAHIFDRFFRVPGSDVTGAGLGLAIAREIVLTQGGTIGLHSTPGEGSEFFFDLPPATTGGTS
jgi:signal transduction histidine kinase